MSVSLEHLVAVLALFDLRLRRSVLLLREQLGPRTDEQYRGLYVSDADVERYLDPTISAVDWLRGDLLTPGAEEQFSRMALGIQFRIHQLEQRGELLRLRRVVELFGLNQAESEVLLMAIMPEINLKYERIFGYLQDDVSRKRPSVELVFRLLAGRFVDQARLRSCLSENAPLRYWRLISFAEDPPRPGLLGQVLLPSDAIVNFLLDQDPVDEALYVLQPKVYTSTSEAAASSHGAATLQIWAQNWQSYFKDREPVAVFYGKRGSGRKSAARHLARLLQRPLLFLDASLADEKTDLVELLRLADRDAMLRGAMLVLENFERTVNGQSRLERKVHHQIGKTRSAVILITHGSGETWEERAVLELNLAAGATKSNSFFGSDNLPEEQAVWRELAGRFDLTAGQISAAGRMAELLALSRGAAGEVSTRDREEACRRLTQPNLGNLAKRLETRQSWDDLVIAAPALQTLKLITATLRQRMRVHEEWGFADRLSDGLGVIALFAGVSGTGKTMSARIIARELGLELFRIDLSTVVNKYIGETEKNLERIFSEAQRSDAILFFDEADAIFGKRSEVRDAHDRYANLETAYLLQRTEEYRGLVILASNFKRNIDEAFLRRIHFVIDFALPEEPERLEIWKRCLPSQAPLAEDVDLPYLANRLKISGGHIRNIVLTAAFMAADSGGPIAMAHFKAATALEMQKLGRMFEGF